MRQKPEPKNSTIVELRQDGHQTVVPPSLHESGELCGWDEEGEPAEVDANDLFQRVHILAAAALLARHWPAKGRRHDAALALSGMLLRAGWDAERLLISSVLLPQPQVMKSNACEYATSSRPPSVTMQAELQQVRQHYQKLSEIPLCSECESGWVSHALR